MPVKQSTFIRTSAALLVVGLLALLGIVGTTMSLVGRAQHYFNDVIEERDLRTATTDLRIVLHELESSQRGFLLTQEESYLEPYDDARKRITTVFERLLAAVERHPDYKARLEQLFPALEVKFAEMQQTIDLARADRTADALAIVATDRGKKIMDDARVLLREIVRSADSGLTLGIEEQRNSANLLHLVTILGGLLIIGVVGSSVWIEVAWFV